MARRFLLHTRADDFTVSVNGNPLPAAEDESAIDLLYPLDYEDAQKPPALEEIKGEWGSEYLANGNAIKWRIAFYKKPIEEEELRGISVFAHFKLAQRPFFFNLTGGLGGQHGLEYMTGQIEADYLDELPKDLIATERQRINWESDEAGPLLVWGQSRIKELLRLWKEKRAQIKLRLLNQKVAPFQSRLDRLQKHERAVVERALRNLASIAAIEEEDFFAMGDSLLLAWEDGRLRDLISTMSDAADMDEKELLDILVEAQVLTALHTAEAVRAKLDLIAGLNERIAKRELENAVRDYIADNAWLIDPIWETFQVEKSIENVVKLALQKAELDGEDDWQKRIDLILSSGDQLLVVEFMRPGITIDYDHISRFELYVRTLETELRANTASPFKRVAGYLVADRLSRNPTFLNKLQALARDQMFALDWKTLLLRSAAKWKDFLAVLVARAPEDERLMQLAKELGLPMIN